MPEPHRNDRALEADLERLFSNTPAMPDADLFAYQVQTRLNRGWNVRRIGIGAAGLAGGVIAVTQMLGSGVTVELQQASKGSIATAEGLYRRGLTEVGSLSQALPFENMGVNLFWVASGLLVLFAVAATTRLFDEV